MTTTQRLLRQVGLVIRGARKKLDLTQEELVPLAGLRHTYIGAIERGERDLSVATLHRTAIGCASRPRRF